jgi:hypothetical protein
LRRRLGLRFLVEAAFVVLVAALAWRDGLSAAGVAGSVAVAWLLVAFAEWRLRGREPPRPEPEVAATLPSTLPAWNLWDLERSVQETVGADTARDEERSFLLMYLREFADAEGVLPAEFDPLVRETFGDLVETARP